MTPIFLDIEASSWGVDSFPIEIAWGSSTSDIRNYLINPDGIPNWTDWSSKAEKVHGISREMLLSEGISPKKMCELLSDNLEGMTVYTDAPDFDGVWLVSLFDACKIKPISIDLRSFDELMITSYSKGMDTRLYDLKQLHRFKSKAKNFDKQHRASWDVEYLVRAWQLTQKS